MMLAVACAACSPALNWREVRPEGTGAEALFPCKPRRESRPLVLAGASVQMSLWACDADGTTWALAVTDIREPNRVSAALEQLGAAAARNIGAPAAERRALNVPGMTPNEHAERLVLFGTRADGSAVRSHIALFTKGTRVFQAAVVGPQPPAEAVEIFFGALRIPA